MLIRNVVFLVVVVAGLYLINDRMRRSTDQTVIEEGKLKYPIRWDHSASEIKDICELAIENYNRALDQVAKQAPSFENSVLGLERAMTTLSNTTSPMTFYKYVSTDAEKRKVSDECEKQISKLMVDTFTREDLFLPIKEVAKTKDSLSEVDQKLLKDYVDGFVFNGLNLPPEKREEFITLKKRSVDLSSEFQKRLNEWEDSLLVDPAQLEGLSKAFIDSLETKDGKKVLTLAYPHVTAVLEGARSADLRRSLQQKFLTRGGKENREMLRENLEIRQKMAEMLGFKNHASVRLEDRMARSPEEVMGFLKRIKKGLEPLAQEEMKVLVEMKKKDQSLKEATIQLEDWRYYMTQWKKEKFSVDQDKIKEYFPMEKVVGGMFEIYQTLLGVNFVEQKNPGLWDPSATAYAVIPHGSDQAVAYFYMDLFPRDGKYGHAAAFTLVQGYTMRDGVYQTPVSAIVANFTAPTKDAPSLLTHSEVETLFHEFGHIMHQVLTTAPYASLSGTSVKRDFVEAPSQMLESWVWDKDMLKKMSGHYKTGEALPDVEIERMIKAKNAGNGLFYLRQAFFATLDMTYHALANAEEAKAYDTTKVYFDLQNEIMNIPAPADTYPEASFGHLMGGYDAGYYGYLWSEVFAADMFTRFEKEGLLNTEAGRDYLKWILQPGGTQDPAALIKGFLGREPNEKAFIEHLGIE